VLECSRRRGEGRPTTKRILQNDHLIVKRAVISIVYKIEKRSFAKKLRGARLRVFLRGMVLGDNKSCRRVSR
jgi:hypothetical protein